MSTKPEGRKTHTHTGSRRARRIPTHTPTTNIHTQRLQDSKVPSDFYKGRQIWGKLSWQQTKRTPVEARTGVAAGVVTRKGNTLSALMCSSLLPAPCTLHPAAAVVRRATPFKAVCLSGPGVAPLRPPLCWLKYFMGCQHCRCRRDCLCRPPAKSTSFMWSVRSSSLSGAWLVFCVRG